MLSIALELSGSEAGENVVLFVFFSLLLGTVTRHISKDLGLRIPYTVLLLLLGFLWGTFEFAASLHLGRLGDAIKILVNINPTLLFLLFLPALIFESSFSVNPHIMQREMGQALLLAIPGLLLASVLTAVVARYVFDYGWSWDVSILFGSILSATDPVAVVALLRELGSSKRLATLIEAESLLNDGSAVVVYIIMLDRVAQEFKQPHEVILLFCRLTIGGFVLGVTFGMIAAFWLRRVYRDSLVETSITIIAAYLSFWTAESLGLEVSGVLTCVFLGLYLANFKTEVSPEVEKSMHHVWQMISYFANTLLFVLSGAIVASKILQDKFRALDFLLLFVLYLFLHIIRLFMILVFSPLIRKLGYGLQWQDALILGFGGLRGAIALALALKTDLSEDVDDATSDRILFHVSGIVLLTLVINATCMRYLLRALGRDSSSESGSKGPGTVFKKASAYIECQTAALLASCAHERYYRGADLARIRSQLPAFLPPEETEQALDTINVNETDVPDNFVALERARTLSIAPCAAGGGVGLSRMRTNSMMGKASVGLAEFRHVFILAMRASFHELFEEGMVGPSATRILIDSCEYGLDTDDFYEQWAVLEPLLSLPMWLERLYDIRTLRRFLRAVVVKRLSLAVELVAAYVRAAQNASQHIIDTLEDVNSEVSFLQSRAQLDTLVARASNIWLGIQVRYRDLHRAIQARHLTEFVLIREQELVSSLYQKGILEEAEYMQMHSIVDKRIRKLRRSLELGHGIAVSAHDKFHAADLISILPHATRSMLLKESQSIVLQQDETLFSAFDHCDSVYVVTHGILLVEHPGLADETVASGTVLGLYELLTGSRYLATAIAASDVEVRRITLPLLMQVMRDQMQHDLVWEYTGRSLAHLSFFRAFLPSSAIAASSLLQRSYLVQPTPDAVVDLQTPALLLTGEAKFEMRPSKSDKPDATAPSLLLPSFRMYRFSEGTRLLQFPTRWELPYADVVLRSPAYDKLTGLDPNDIKLARARSLPFYERDGISSFPDQPITSSMVELARSSTLHPQFHSSRAYPSGGPLPEDCDNIRPVLFFKPQLNWGKAQDDVQSKDHGTAINPIRLGASHEKPILHRVRSLVSIPDQDSHSTTPLLSRASTLDVHGRGDPAA